MGLVLRGIFLAREKDYQWLYQDGTSRIFPDYWKEFIQLIPEEEQSDMISAYYNRLHGEDELAKMAAAKHWSQWEGQCATLNPCKRVMERFTEAHTALSLALIETHYFKNRCFIKSDQILREVYKLEKIPGIIVHGRYDMLCTLDNASLLHQAWPNSELYIIRDAGHVSSEPGIVDALISATEKIAKLFV
jgi:proline iminopeptidase